MQSRPCGCFARRRSDGRGWPYAWYALGLAEAQRASWEQSDRLALGSRVGVGNLERSAERQRRALEADPTFVPAAIELAELTLGLRDTSLMRPAVTALRRAAAVPDADPEVLLATGRVERATGHLDSAGVAFERFLAAGGSRALGLLELARTRLAEGREDAQRAYYEGAAFDDPSAVAGYRADLAMIAADFELARFDHAHGRNRAELLRRFWTDRDRLEMRAPGERIREHYRRLLHARRALRVDREPAVLRAGGRLPLGRNGDRRPRRDLRPPRRAGGAAAAVRVSA